jgi:hypothetical protein
MKKDKENQKLLQRNSQTKKVKDKCQSQKLRQSQERN